MACCCENWAEFTREFEEWGIYKLVKIDFDDPELDIEQLDQFMVSQKTDICRGRLLKCIQEKTI